MCGAQASERDGAASSKPRKAKQRQNWCECEIFHRTLCMQSKSKHIRNWKSNQQPPPPPTPRRSHHGRNDNYKPSQPKKKRTMEETTFEIFDALSTSSTHTHIGWLIMMTQCAIRWRNKEKHLIIFQIPGNVLNSKRKSTHIFTRLRPLPHNAYELQIIGYYANFSDSEVNKWAV